MAKKNILIKKKNGTTWDELYPITTANNIKTSDGSSLEAHLAGNAILNNFSPVWMDDFNKDTRSDYAVTNCTLSIPDDSIMRITTVLDQQIVFDIPDLIEFDGGINRYIIIRYKVISGSPSAGQIFYETANHIVSGSYFKSGIQLIADNNWHVMIIDMYSLTTGGDDWRDSKIKLIRFDFTDASNIVFDLDYIAIGTTAPGTRYCPDDLQVEGKIYVNGIDLFQFANSNWTELVNAIGELPPTSTKAATAQYINDRKYQLATTLVSKGVTADASEMLTTLISKVGQINTTLKAGDILLINEDNLVTETYSTNGKIVKEIKIGYGGTIRVTFDLRCVNGVANGHIFVNGVAKGINRSTTSQSYVTFTEDISINAGDIVQLDLFNQNGMVDNQNFKISIDYGIAQIIK